MTKLLQEARFVVQREPQTLNARDRCGWTPLHEAVNCGDEEMCRLLLDAGADINARAELALQTTHICL